MGQTYSTDVAIIGAGPAGMFAVFELGMLKIDCVLIDSLQELGGQCTALYPEKPIYDIPGHPAILAGTLITQLEQQIAPFSTPQLLGRRIEKIDGTIGAFTLQTDRGDRVHAKAIILAAGAGAFGPNRPPLAGLEPYEATGAVRYAVKEREALRGQQVVIAGGGDSAVDWALALRGVASSIKFVHRRSKLRAAPASVEELTKASASGEVEMVIPYLLHALHGSNGKLTNVEVADVDGRRKLLVADVLLPFFGLSTDLGPIAGWQLALERNHVHVTPATGQTSRSGIFAIGDVCTYPGKLKLILQGFSEAAVVAHAVYAIVHAGSALHFEYSTTKGLPS